MNDVTTMRAAVFFEGDDVRRRHSRFWMLLALASVIAAAGVVGDSTATVIGAMIVAPLMTPILGIVLATVLGDRRNLVRSWIVTIAGSVGAVAVGFALGLLVAPPVVAATNSQVAGRVTPHLVDLLAALATGAVAAIALVRKDISDTLPGVAIAISLVPPLSVVGLTLEAGAPSEALGALLLFATNVAAILATGVVVLLVCHVRPAAAGERAVTRPTRSLVAIAVTLVIIGIPLVLSSARVTADQLLVSEVDRVVAPWAETNGWEIVSRRMDGDVLEIRLTGRPPVPDTSDLASRLREAGTDPSVLRLEFVPSYAVTLDDPTP